MNNIFDLTFQLQAHVLEIRVEDTEAKVTATHYLPDRKICQVTRIPECTADDFYDNIFDSLLEFRKAVANWRAKKFS